jgi:integrase
VKKKQKQFTGGIPFVVEGSAEVSAVALQKCSAPEAIVKILALMLTLFQSTSEKPVDVPLSTPSKTTNCDRLPGRGQKFGERGGGLARRRYQKGRLFLRGKKGNEKWVGRWREDEIIDGKILRPERSEVLGSKAKLSKRLALRELEKRLIVVNDPRYRARPTATFSEFAFRWETSVLTQFKPSTQATIRSHLRKHLIPYFGRKQMRDIGPEEAQCFVASVEAGSKTKKNIFATFQMIWKTARSWGYVAHDATSDVVLPRRSRVVRRFFSVEEVRRILDGAPEPYRTFYWLAVETGMRAGELCGLRVCDIDLHGSVVNVRQSAWRGKIQSPKTENAVRRFALSSGLLARLLEHIESMRPNEKRLLFATRTGTPWDANLLVKRKLHPLLDALSIERGGLHAFRHTNSTLMDQLGAPFKVRQQRLGHSNVTQTLDAYTHVVSADDFRLAEQLDRILRPNAPKLKEEGVAPGGQPLVN